MFRSATLLSVHLTRVSVAATPSRRRFATARFLAMALLAVPGLLMSAAGAASTSTGQDSVIVWVDVEGKPLPFQQDAELAEFLRSAKIVGNTKIEIGITEPRKLVLEQNGIRVHAAFRNVDETHSRVRMGDGSFYQKLRDYCGFEIAAYELSKMLGMDNVPPAVGRRLGRTDGSLQIWVEGTMMESERVEKGLRSPNFVGWRRQVQEMLLFDELIGNIDRNPGNLLIDKNWKIWLIDHTRAFQQGKELKKAAKITWVRQGFWDRLQALDRDTVISAIDNFVAARGIDDMFKRRDSLVEHIQGLIEERGAEAVLYQ